MKLLEETHQLNSSSLIFTPQMHKNLFSVIHTKFTIVYFCSIFSLLSPKLCPNMPALNT